MYGVHSPSDGVRKMGDIQVVATILLTGGKHAHHLFLRPFYISSLFAYPNCLHFSYI